ncbi:putative alpha-1,2-mannosidase [Mucilaginibacter yixingensis]|uniref:Putative alpha-1,2-mannosidase n=1 Tax=Mucilaginibacter yixingensis TaxID=1295612 RepID=A0A2T5JGE3_9SPHI|nr:GH92 family glycosyl hydrolase [Mucilaginibacter yixingensis]PTR01513.1 putative alpha-1,2-mannosidase [Mucilaginibacter yixingensis]
MKKILALLLIVATLPAARAQHREQLTDYVNPMIGTAPGSTPSAQKHGEGGEQYGNVIPSVGLPFAMTQWTPQTRRGETKCEPPYLYRDTIFSGIRATHWLSGSCVPDYGSFTVMPLVGKLRLKNAQAPLVHTREIARPGFYQLTIPGLTIRVTATLRCGIMELTMDHADSLYVLISSNSDKGKGAVSVDQKGGSVSVTNQAFRIYQGAGQPAGFSGHSYTRFSKRPARTGVFAAGKLLGGDQVSNQPGMGSYAGFYLKKGERLMLRIGASFTGAAGAKENLQAELGNQTFESISTRARQTWEQALGSIQITDHDQQKKRIFYTALFHALQMPRLYSDVSGAYPMFSHQYQTARMPAGQAYYDDFSMWDIYRAQLPLLTILYPKLTAQLVQSLIIKGTQGGWMPIFPCWNSYTNEMIGDHVAAFMASAYNKGIRGFNVQQGYALLRQNAFEQPSRENYLNGNGRRALPSYLKYGYIPLEDSVKDAFHQQEQVSRTLEYAYDDYALGTLALALGKKADAAVLHGRSLNYRKVIDPQTGFARGRYADGRWITPFYPDKKVWYITEGTPRQYTFYVPQDIDGLSQLLGGGNRLEQALDSLFQKGEYWHGNEPGHQIPFMYNHTRSPWKTQMVVDSLLKAEYNDQPGGLSGNDDAGQMSAWYVLASLGFYPLDPASTNYELCSPQFSKAEIRLAKGKKLVITCRKTSPRAIYIKSLRINGKLFTGHQITHQLFKDGGTMAFLLGDKP